MTACLVRSRSVDCYSPSSCFSTMMSAAPAKRMVSSVFITLASPYRATVTPNSHIHSTKARDPLNSALPLSPGYSPSEPQLAQRRPSAASQDGHNRTQLPSPAPASAPEPIPAPPSPVTTVGKDRVPGRGEGPKQKPPTAGTTSDGNLLPDNIDLVKEYMVFWCSNMLTSSIYALS